MLPLSIFFPLSRQAQITGIISFVSLALTGVFLYEMYAQPLPQAHAASASASGTVYLSPSAQAAGAASSTQKAPMLEVHIANNGLVLLRGARVLSVSGSTIRVGMVWDSSSFTWDVHTRYNTQFFSSTGAKETLNDIGIGDVVTVTGQLSANGSVQAVDADYVRE